MTQRPCATRSVHDMGASRTKVGLEKTLEYIELLGRLQFS